MNAIIFSALGGVIMMFSSFLLKNKSWLKYIAMIVLAIVFVANYQEIYGTLHFNIDTKGMFAFTKFGLYFNSLMIISIFLYFLVSGSQIEKVGNYPAEYFALIFFILDGVFILSSYNSLLTLFLGIEIMTIPLYILTGAEKNNLKGNEASLKYFLMGTFSTGIMLMGIALLYGATGTFNIEAMSSLSSLGVPFYGILEPLGMIFILVAFLFKVSAAPFHFWAPDVYDGAPSVFTGLMASVVKAAGFIAFIHLFQNKSVEMADSWKILLPFFIILTLLFGNITAVFQQSVKRMLAYSSIAQAGFMLFALYNNNFSKEGILIYTIAYTVATLGIFSILGKMKDHSYDGFNGLAKKQPFVAFANTVFFMSLAGIPLTGGFFAKYFMLSAAISANGIGILWLVIVALIFAAVSVYYYFGVIKSMYFKEGEAEISDVTPAYKYALVILVAIVFILGIYPSIITNWLYF